MRPEWLVRWFDAGGHLRGYATCAHQKQATARVNTHDRRSVRAEVLSPEGARFVFKRAGDAWELVS